MSHQKLYDAMTPAQLKAQGAAPANTIAFQGEPGAYSHIACQKVYPDMVPLACPTFYDAFVAIREGKADYGMIAIDNSLAGRVGDIHHLLPESDLYMIGETFLPVHHQLLGRADATLDQITEAHSHIMALGQCRKVMRDRDITPIVKADTAGSARLLSSEGQPHQAAIASDLAAKVYDLQILQKDIEDSPDNTTRFVIMAREPLPLETLALTDDLITAVVFQVRNVPSALYKALGGFATNNVNMIKLESYQIGARFEATQFYLETEGHPDDTPLKLALEELSFFTNKITRLGTFRADTFRKQAG